jgi:hypothetical protein
MASYRLSPHHRNHLPQDLNFHRSGDVKGHLHSLLSQSPATFTEAIDAVGHLCEFDRAMAEARLLALLDLSRAPEQSWRIDLYHKMQNLEILELAQPRHQLDQACLGALNSHTELAPEQVSFLEAARGRCNVYRDTNLILLQRHAELETAMLCLIGALKMEISGKSEGLQSPLLAMTDPDPIFRQRCWLASMEKLHDVQSVADDMLDELLALREQIARNADCDTWIDYLSASGRSVNDLSNHSFPLFDPFTSKLQDPVESLDPWNLYHNAETEHLPRLAAPSLAELIDFLKRCMPDLELTLKLLLPAERQHRAAKDAGFGFDGVLWLPESRQPVLRMPLAGLDVDLCRFVTAVLVSHRAVAGARLRADAVLTMLPEDLALAVRLSLEFLAEYDPGSVPVRRTILRRRRRVELRQLCAREHWNAWIHTQQGASRDERHNSWLLIQRMTFPEMKPVHPELQVASSLLDQALFLSSLPPLRSSRLQLDGWLMSMKLDDSIRAERSYRLRFGSNHK